MKALDELGSALRERRQQLHLKQQDVAARAGVTHGSLCRLEKGHLPEFGVRKLLAILAVLNLEMRFGERGTGGSLDELRKERGGT